VIAAATNSPPAAQQHRTIPPRLTAEHRRPFAISSVLKRRISIERHTKEQRIDSRLRKHNFR
jgi:hypothetical protein